MSGHSIGVERTPEARLSALIKICVKSIFPKFVSFLSKSEWSPGISRSSLDPCYVELSRSMNVRRRLKREDAVYLVLR